ncbi:threonine synthase [Limnochorda pilosa]|uniref:Threonine synthase n=1 Tax=Limnochorda pilosa TaxID=1555112 RepID=A0A0K2SI38_LIMPI|nr:pyridoxal-phosphate dependent enzyme [Limnochorda pilosa]BAS26768.1 threonine synthase [Limnochorda pilosa]
MIRSLAIGQISLGTGQYRYPLWPPLTEGCPRSSTSEIAYPLTVDYDYSRVSAGLFDQPALPGLDRWTPLLPPLDERLALGEGGTALIPLEGGAGGWDGRLYIKDESRNPTWSHKDRLNRCAVSAAALSGSAGVVVASSGNHAGSAAAYAARAGLPCVALVSAGAPLEVQAWIRSYGAVVLQVEREARWSVMRQIVRQLGYHPVSNLTEGGHTGHPFGPEGYKSIAYELFLQLGRRPPAAVFVPTGYGELLFGVWKGFAELQRLGLSPTVPRMFACEPAARAPLFQALAQGRPVAAVPARPTRAVSIATTVSGYRALLAVQESGGWAIRVTDADLVASREGLARAGIWAELSAAAGLAGCRLALDQGERFDGPVVCISTASGFKRWADGSGAKPAPQVSDDLFEINRVLRSHYGLDV